MAFNKSGKSAGEMLSGLKSRLGFSHSEDEDEEFSQYDADFDEYDDFDDDYESDYARDYDDYDGYSTRDVEEVDVASTGGFKAVTTHSSRFGRPDSTPNLVSIDDVREHSARIGSSSRGTYEQARRNGLAGRRTAAGRSLIESGSPAPSSPAYTAAQRESSSRSEGLNSLFESTSPRQDRYAATSAIASERGLTVLKPVTYNDVEGVARALKAGDAVVLVMTQTPTELFTRILDFSFGVASALEGAVECPAEKVYAIVCGNPLTEAEKSRLQSQGVL